MGMFNWVNLKIKCPNCGEVVSGFQTKDGELSCTTVEYERVNDFYSDCEKCGCWIQFTRKPVGGILKDFDIKVFESFCGERIMSFEYNATVELVE